MSQSLGKLAEIGVFGGSGFYSFLDKVEELKVETPYGNPSAKLAIGEIEGRKVVFLPRHGKDHELPPHMINYRANIWAMKKVGVERILAPCATGSLQTDVKPGDFIICDQYVDRTKGRFDTFYDGPIPTHISSAEPYCANLRDIAIKVAKELDISVKEKGTVVTIQGPRFSTKAESKWFSSQGFEVINMTQYPEVALARELEMCYLNISLITDYDVGLDGHPEIKPVTADEVFKVFNENNEKVKKMILSIIPKIAGKRDCECASALEGARLG
ncbi:MAG: S-methyl-5'-thioadenosine phosphorylase [Actinobacteria bacterium]|nr:MAG: S-methyl-5'-thioadenosine phosphorylase [Actinomycetota bacterium]